MFLIRSSINAVKIQWLVREDITSCGIFRMSNVDLNLHYPIAATLEKIVPRDFSRYHNSYLEILGKYIYMFKLILINRICSIAVARRVLTSVVGSLAPRKR